MSEYSDGTNSGSDRTEEKANGPRTEERAYRGQAADPGAGFRGGFGGWWDERSLAVKLLLGTGIAVLIAAAAGLFGLVIMLLWNWLMPDIFGLKTISYWQGWGLFLLSSIFFKGMGSDESGRPSDRRRKRKIRNYMRQSREGGAE